MFNKTTAVSLILAVTLSTSAGAITFNKTKLADVKGKNADVQLALDEKSKAVSVKTMGRDLATIPYDAIDKITYEYSKKHRVGTGAVVAIASLGAGFIVMATSSKLHWLTIDYHEGTNAKTITLRLDKSEYKDVLRATESQTGKTVERLGKVKK